MIITLNKAIVHIIAPGIDTSVYSDKTIDLTDAGVSNYIISHLEKMYDDPAMRPGEFASNSGFKFHIAEYNNRAATFEELSLVTAKKLQEGISQSEVGLSSDIIVCECVIHERTYIAVLKCDNKQGFTHRVVQDGDMTKNEIINYYAILPTTQRLTDAAFINIETNEILFKGKSVKLDGERHNLISDILLECDFGISTKESYTIVQKAAKEVTEEYGGDTVEADARLKKVIKELPAEEDTVETAKIAEAVFTASPAARDDFMHKIAEADVPPAIEKTEYVEKRVDKNIKIVTDTGVEISFPAEYYQDEENVSIINHDDGTVSIQINNISSILNKS